MTAIILLVILIIAIIPVAMVLRSKRRRLSVRSSGDPAADPASTLRLGADPPVSSAASPSRASASSHSAPRDRKPGSKDATAASDPKSTLKLS